ncbi:MAG TPA: ACP S-malonyltransferase [Gammaproteobacteria bacterium]|jgi:[acyl-carrier-protein] S-malonyltransferase|nr:ACP S-malonyltransferase [Gammaproteobacteria bacterium]
MSFAAVFPGQGSQSIGMLSELGPAHPEVQQTFAEASSVLGYDLWTLCQQGPEDRLNSTQQTQPALLAAGTAVWRAWKAASGADPAAMAGHSLGEYTALVCAGALDFKAAIKLVEFRGLAMQEAVPAGQGAMAAIIGLDDDAVRAACAEAAQGEVVEAVNFNAPGQVVIAGSKAAVERAGEACKARGAKRALLLPVSAPSHCALMKPAAERLAQKLAALDVKAPRIPVIHNVDVRAHSNPDEIRAMLKAQLHSPVRWVETVQKLAGDGLMKQLEFGPGKVLVGLAKRIDKSVECLPVYDPTTLQAALAAAGA